MKSSHEDISVKDAADRLLVSQATVHNWSKSGILRREGSGFSGIENTIRSLRSGDLGKLRSRANKKFSDNAYKALNGSFYTPENIVCEIINDYDMRKGSLFCDPCCGSGVFLSTAAKKYGNSVRLYGYETDLSAAEKTKKDLNLAGYECMISNADFLTVDTGKKFDFIFTNPPWGAHFSKDAVKYLKEIYPDSKSKDSLEYFIRKSFNVLKKDGIMSFILPESVLTVKRFSELRDFILKKTSILKIKNYGRIFPGVFTEAVRIDMKKKKPSDDHTVNNSCNMYLLQSDLLNGKDNKFDIYNSQTERVLVKKIFEIPHITLKNRAEWSLGIVTGNNSVFVSEKKTKKHIHRTVTGKNIMPYRIGGDHVYLSDDFDRMQQVPKNMIFGREKLFYKFISSKPVFAYDRSGFLSLNSANILIPDLPGYTIMSVMAILNSEIIGRIYKAEFPGIKVLKSALEELPFPKDPDMNIIKKIDSLVRRMTATDICYSNSEKKINYLVNKLYGVKDES